MSMPILNLVGTEEPATTGSGTASTVSSARIVRCHNTDTNAHLVTLEQEDGTDIGTATLAAGETLLIHKDKTDQLLAADTTVRLAPVTIYQG